MGQPKDLTERTRIATIFLRKPKEDETFDQRVARFNEIGTKNDRVKALTISAVDRDEARVQREAEFIVLGEPIGTWLPKRVVILGEHDAIVEYVSNVDSNIQKKGDVMFMTVVNGECTRMMHNEFDQTLLHYLSVKHEGRGTAFHGSFVNYAMAMLKSGEE